jgi:hypothetical protein
MLFPRGLIHWQFNPEREPAVFVAGFDENDPGRVEAAHGLFSGTPDEVLQARAGYSEFLDPAQIVGPGLTSDFTSIVESCAKKCGSEGCSEHLRCADVVNLSEGSSR